MLQRLERAHVAHTGYARDSRSSSLT